MMKVINIKDYFKVVKGTLLSSVLTQIKTPNSIPCIVAKNNNNGVGGYIDRVLLQQDNASLLKKLQHSLVTQPGLVLIANGDGGAGLSFYVNEPQFFVNASVFALLPVVDEVKAHLNLFTGLYFAACISMHKPEFGHDRPVKKITYNNYETVDLKIQVPWNKTTNAIDWIAMEQTVTELYNSLQETFATMDKTINKYIKDI